jgi:hypothetical protein
MAFGGPHIKRLLCQILSICFRARQAQSETVKGLVVVADDSFKRIDAIHKAFRLGFDCSNLRLPVITPDKERYNGTKELTKLRSSGFGLNVDGWDFKGRPKQQHLTYRKHLLPTTGLPF